MNETHAIVRRDPVPTHTPRFTADQVDLIKRTLFKGVATDDELALFMHQVEKTKLDPLARQIYPMKRYDSVQGRDVMSIGTSIDGFRLIAERSGKYAGQVGPYWCGDDGIWVDVWIAAKAPKAARVGVLRHDFKEPCWGVARYESYAQKKKDGGVTRAWANMGDLMIAKCAEALALRKAFPQELSGVYTNDEMDAVPSSGASDVTLGQDALSKAKSRTVYDALIKETRQFSSRDALTKWGLENTDRIHSMHADFQKWFREEYKNRLTAIDEGVTEEGEVIEDDNND